MAVRTSEKSPGVLNLEVGGDENMLETHNSQLGPGTYTSRRGKKTHARKTENRQE